MLRQTLCIVLVGLLLIGCDVIEAPPLATATPEPAAEATTATGPTLEAHGAVATLTATLEPTLPVATPTNRPTQPPTPTNRPTPTVEPTLTPQPTVTLPPLQEEAPRITIERPVTGMFVSTTIEISGTIAGVSSGDVRAQIATPDGTSLGVVPAMIGTEPSEEGLHFRGELILGSAPTPRGVVLSVEYLDDGDVRSFAQQPINVPGRFARLQYLIVEAPLPYTRNAAETLLVRGAAPGPPNEVQVRVLDSGGQVLQSVPGTLGWLQPGLPCDFTATVNNVPEATTIEIVSLGPDAAILERIQVPLGKPVQ